MPEELAPDGLPVPAHPTPESIDGGTYQGEGKHLTHVTTWTPKGWKPLYTQIVRMHVNGMTRRQMQAELKRWGVKFSGTSMTCVVNSPRGRELAGLMRAAKRGELHGELAEYLAEAVGVELEVMRNPFGEDRHRLNAAQDLMDRGGMPKVSRREGDNQPNQTIVLNLTPEQLKHLLLPPPVIEAEEIVIDKHLPSPDDD